MRYENRELRKLLQRGISSSSYRINYRTDTLIRILWRSTSSLKKHIAHLKILPTITPLRDESRIRSQPVVLKCLKNWPKLLIATSQNKRGRLGKRGTIQNPGNKILQRTHEEFSQMKTQSREFIRFQSKWKRRLRKHVTKYLRIFQLVWISRV